MYIRVVQIRILQIQMCIRHIALISRVSRRTCVLQARLQRLRKSTSEL